MASIPTRDHNCSRLVASVIFDLSRRLDGGVVSVGCQFMYIMAVAV
jgi:hypothetical protein